MKIIKLTNREANDLLLYLSSLIGKGSLSTTPSWARNVIRKIKLAELEKEGGT